MNAITQEINAYLNGELEECEVINFQDEIQSDESLGLKVSEEILRMMQEERAYRVNELNDINGGVIPNRKPIRKVKAHNPTAFLLQLLRKKS